MNQQENKPVEAPSAIPEEGQAAARQEPTEAKERQDTPKEGGPEAAATVSEAPTLKEVIQEQATEEDSPQAKNFTLMKILGGDILNTQAIRRQIWVILLIAFFLVLYISNRYSVQQDLIEIDNLQKELQDAKYKALSTGSQLTEQSRESYVLELLKTNKDSTLKMSSQPPYIINVPNE